MCDARADAKADEAPLADSETPIAAAEMRRHMSRCIEDELSESSIKRLFFCVSWIVGVERFKVHANGCSINFDKLSDSAIIRIHEFYQRLRAQEEMMAELAASAPEALVYPPIRSLHESPPSPSDY